MGSRWQDTGAPRGDDYDTRWQKLAAAGESIHGEADLGDVSTLPLFRDPFVFAAAAGHALATRKTVRAADLRAQRVLLLEDGHCLKDQAWAICQAEGVRDYVDFRATSLATLAQMVSSGAGVTLLPQLSVPTVGSLPGLVVKPFAKPVPYRTIGIAWRPTSPRRELFEAIGEVLRELAPVRERQSAAAR